MNTPEWRNREFQFIPLCFYLRMTGRVEREANGSVERGYEKKASGLALRQMELPSRLVDDDEIFMGDANFPRMLADDWKEIANREEFCRSLHKQFTTKFGYGEW